MVRCAVDLTNDGWMDEWGDSLVHMDGSKLKALLYRERSYREIKYIPFYLCPSRWTAQAFYPVSGK